MTRFIDRFDVLLLDMGETFMFGCDRFGEDLGSTYAALGGRRLEAREVGRLLEALLHALLPIARDPRRFESFPTVAAHLAQLPQAAHLPPAEQDLLAQTFALHEVGTIPPSHADALARLSRTHRLGLISNVWSDREVFVRETMRAGVWSLFETVVFSSEHGCIKPSPRLFELAIEAMACDRAKTVYIGDKLYRDVAGAKAAGLACIWVNKTAAPRPESAPKPDLEVRCISQLLDSQGRS